MDDLDVTGLLALLREIHVPEALPEPSLWPILLSALVIAFTMLLWLLRLRRKPSWVSQATAELHEIESNPRCDAHLQIAKLLKRIALTVDQRPEVKNLSGEAWLRYLDQFFNTQFFTSGAGKRYGNRLYTRRDETQPDNLPPYNELRRLIRRRGWSS